MKNQAKFKRSVVYTLITSTALLGAVDANASIFDSLRNAFSGMSRELQQTYNKGIDSSSDFAKDLGSNLADAGRDLAGSTVSAAQDLNNDLNAVGNSAYGTAASVINEVNSAKDVLKNANDLLAQTDNLLNIALAELDRLQREQLNLLLQTAFTSLRAAHLDELANVSKIADEEFWTKTVMNAVVKNITGSSVVEDAVSLAGQITNGLGTPSATHPFGDGPFGKTIETTTQSLLDQALSGASGELAALNPLNNSKLKANPTQHANTFKDYFTVDLPEPLQFKYEVAMQVKPITVTWTNFATSSSGARVQVNDSKVGFAFKVPLINGTWDKEDTVLSNAVKKKRFNFQVSMALAGTNTKKQQAAMNDITIAQESQFAFDISCSTQNIGQCQLQKIGAKSKYSAQQENGGAQLSDMIQAINAVLNVMDNQIALTVLFGSDQSKKNDFKAALGEIKGYVGGAAKMVSMVEPPSNNAAEHGLALTESLGFWGPLAKLSKSADKMAYGVLGSSPMASDLLGPLAVFAPGLNNYQKGGTTFSDDSVQYNADGTPKYAPGDLDANGKPKAGKKPLKNPAPGFATKSAYKENRNIDVSVGVQWLNADYMNNTFKAGFTPTQRTKDQGLPQVLNIELGKGANSEFKVGTAPNTANTTRWSAAKIEALKDDDFELAFSASIDTRASFGLSIPFHKEAANWLRAQGIGTVSLSDFELNQIGNLAGNDPYNIASSKTWSDPVDSLVLPTAAAAGAVRDVLTLPVFIAIQAR